MSVRLQPFSLPAIALCCLVFASAAFSDEPTLVLQPGDSIAFIGNTLADRMQHDGWLETRIQAAFPQHGLTFRNLGFPGDELKDREE